LFIVHIDEKLKLIKSTSHWTLEQEQLCMNSTIYRPKESVTEKLENGVVRNVWKNSL